MAPVLFLVVLGGRVDRCNIELHDVRWVIGNKIEETYNQLRAEWFGNKKGLHIDSYIAIKYIDGYEILITHKGNELIPEDLNNNMKLWFVNLGAYSPECLQEQHQFGLIIANSRNNAIVKAKKRWLLSNEYTHKDDIYELNSSQYIDQLNLIENLGNWHIKLKPDPNNRSQDLKPDWYGFKRIDNV